MDLDPERKLQLKAKRSLTSNKGQPGSALGGLWAAAHAGGPGLGDPPLEERVPAGPGHPQHLCPLHSLLRTASFSWSLREHKTSLAEIFLLFSYVQEIILWTHYFQNLMKQGNTKWPRQTDTQSKQSCSYFSEAILSGTNSVSQTNNDLKHFSKLLPTTSLSGDCEMYLPFSATGKTSIICSLKTSGGKDWALTFLL